MTYRRFTPLLFLIVAFVPANAQAAVQIVKLSFITAPQTLSSGSVSEQMTVQAQDSGGNAVAGGIPQTGCLLLTTSSSGGEFSSSAANWSPVSVLTMNKSTANKNFFYKHSGGDAYAITVKMALKPADESRSCANWPTEEWDMQWTATQTGSGSGNNTVVSNSSDIQSVSQSQAQSQNSPMLPPVTARISADARVVVGGGSYFSASASGTAGLPLTGVRFIWSFGDGTSAEGSKVFHAYLYPGKYAVSLTAAYNFSSGMDRVVVEAVEAAVLLRAEGDGSLLIQNNSAEDLNLGLWSLVEDEHQYHIPENTFVLVGEGVRFSPSVTGLAGGTTAALHYPNGSVAAKASPGDASPLRGERVTASELRSLTKPPVSPAAVPLLSEPVEAPETSMAAAAQEADIPSETPNTALWGSLVALVGVLAVGAAGVRYLQPRVPKEAETTVSADEFDIE